ncbi:MAG: Asp-tRNA(Asn)/Glu-tRNA(Gln) amidotransferase subunit GatB [Bacteroidia bacterium]|nr:Asp-tRNA(Asn)/Glu-tRNA(Gln) amidotransferase subunit GatB [Bacteroidia bacterium]
MANPVDKYEAVIGLEIHTQLLTKTKAFSTDIAEYGAMPNTNVSVVNLGHPGTLPRHNKEAVNMALRVGLACGCDITSYCLYARKNYFYADLPKGYQITQDKTPLCTGGSVRIKKEDGSVKDVLLTRIHMEEDSGKSIHDMDLHNSLIDYNRAGTTLVEIVTEPVLRSGEEAGLFVSEVRKLVRYLDVCDGNMEEGSLRCDANISVRLKGATEFGTKVEVKNMNSISNVRKAIEFEVERQVEAVEKGEKLVQETRSFDAVKGITFSMRAKEVATDYRYFPEPDLPPLIVTDEWIDKVRANMPKLPEELYNEFTSDYGLSHYDASVLTENKEVAQYYLDILGHTANFKAAANYLMGPVKAYLNRNAIELSDFALKPRHIADLIRLVDDGTVSNAVAEQKLFGALIERPDETALSIAEEMNVIQNSDDDFLDGLITKALEAFPDKVEEYKNGKKGLLGLFMGEVMKQSGGKADPKLTSQKLRDKLEA